MARVIESHARNRNPLLCIYHGNCADGFAAWWAVWRYFKQKMGREIEGYPGVYQQEPPDVAGKDVIFVDFSYKKPIITKMLEEAASVTIIDHHKSAIEDLAPLANANYQNLDVAFDQAHSGAVLAWLYFWKDNPMPPLLKHIEDRDLWRFTLPSTREIQANLFSYPYELTLWDMFMQESYSPRWLAQFANEGKAIERKHFKDIDELLTVSCRAVAIGGVVVPCANLPYTLASDAAGKLAEQNPEVFAATYFQDKTGDFVFSLRSSGNWDCSKTAVQYGGGGHKKAAGFRVKYEQFLDYPATVLTQEELEKLGDRTGQRA